MKSPTVIMNFSGIYKEENFYENREVCWVECGDISGVNGYCSEEAAEKIKQRMERFDYGGIHFLDSRNYHYLSKFWLEKVRKPFSLVVFDNHTDMQESAFFGLLSCGSWIKEALETNENLREICIIGPSKEAFEQLGNDRQKIISITREELLTVGTEKWMGFLEKNPELPVYFSIDKDVLSFKDARTNWDQGDMKLEEMFRWMELIFPKRQVLGIDICGENPQDTATPLSVEELEINSRTNRRLCEFIENKIFT